MKAIRITKFGGPEVLTLDDAPVPAFAEDELLVKVHAASINPMDRMIFAGFFNDAMPISFPFTMGWDMSGVVEKKGAKVKGFNIGDEIYGRPGIQKGGSFAEYAVVKADDIGNKPKSVDHVHAAAIPVVAQTAWYGLFNYGKLEKGQRVLIHGASGGVGSIAIQLAKWKGAYVIGTGSADNLEYIKQLGADEAIDYKNGQFETKVKNIDLVFDLVGKETQKKSLLVIKPGGRLITTLGPDYKEEAKQKNIQLDTFNAESHTSDLNQIASLIDEGKLVPQVASVIKIEEVIAAETNKSSGRGKMVVSMV